MAKIVTYKVPTADGTTVDMRGYPIRLMIGNERVRFVLQLDAMGEPKTLVHYASGMKVQHLGPIILERYVATTVLLPDYTAAKRAAHIALDRIIAKMGTDETLRRMNAAPVINR